MPRRRFLKKRAEKRKAKKAAAAKEVVLAELTNVPLTVDEDEPEAKVTAVVQTSGESDLLRSDAIYDLDNHLEENLNARGKDLDAEDSKDEWTSQPAQPAQEKSQTYLVTTTYDVDVSHVPIMHQKTGLAPGPSSHHSGSADDGLCGTIKLNLTLKLLNLVSFLILLAASNMLPFGKILESNQTILLPARFTFVIWGVILVFLALFVFYQFTFDLGILPIRWETQTASCELEGGCLDSEDELRPADQIAKSRVMLFTEIGHLFWMANLLSAAWALIFWDNSNESWLIGAGVLLWLSVIIHVIMFRVRRLEKNPGFSNWLEKTIIFTLFGLYAAWTVVGLAMTVLGVLALQEWDFASDKDSYACVGINIVLLLFFAFIGLKTKNYFYPFVLTWLGFGLYWRADTVGVRTSASGYFGGITALMNILVVCWVFITRHDGKKRPSAMLFVELNNSEYAPSTSRM